MNQNSQNESVSNGSESTKHRRVFLTRAAAGAVITALPGKSAWAGVLNSIVASGQGSQSTQGKSLQVYSPGYWKNHCLDNNKFCNVFGGDPLSKTGVYKPRSGSYMLSDVLDNPGGDGGDNGKLGGIANINYFLVATFLNAKYHGSMGIYFPAAGPGKPYNNAYEMAQDLYSKACINPAGVAGTLADIITQYHIS